MSSIDEQENVEENLKASVLNFGLPMDEIPDATDKSSTVGDKNSRSPSVPALNAVNLATDEQAFLPVSPPVRAADPTNGHFGMTEFAQPTDLLEEKEDNRPLDVRFVDKNWRIRSKAYSDLKCQIEATCTGQGSDDELFGKFVSLLSNVASDSSPAALDAGLSLLVVFIDRAPESARVTQYSAKVATAVIDNTFSGRRELQTKGQALLLKLIEVDEPDAVVSVLLTRLTDKKPKIPPACVETLAACLQAFGAQALSSKLPAIIQALPKILDSSNGALREQVMILLAEVARWVGAQSLQVAVIDKLRSAQKTEYDRLLAERSNGELAPTVWLRKTRPSAGITSSVSTAASAKQTSAAPMLFSARDLVAEVDLNSQLKTSEFSRLVKEEKWSDQLQGLQLVLDVLGPSPKMTAGSGSSAAVAAVLEACKTFLRQGHVTVQLAALKVLGLLAIGMQAEFGPLVRPVVQSIVVKCKEKKLATEMQNTLSNILRFCVSMESACADICEHVCNKKIPAPGRVGLIDVVVSSLQTSPDRVSEASLKSLAVAVVAACDDADSTVRESCTSCLSSLLVVARGRGKLGDAAVKVIGALEQTNNKLFKRVTTGGASSGGSSSSTSAGAGSNAANLASDRSSVAAAGSPVKSAAPAKATSPVKSAASAATSRSAGVGSPLKAKKVSAPLAEESSSDANAGESEDPDLDLDSALAALSLLRVEGWNDSAQMLMNSSKWNEKVDALTAMTTQMAALEMGGQLSRPLVAYLSNKTNGLKISNVNVSKAVLTLCTAAAQRTGAEPWHRPSASCLISALADRLADRKQSEEAQRFFTALCEAISPTFVLSRLGRALETFKAPGLHQAFFEWATVLVTEFGMASMPAAALVKLCEPGLAHKMPFVRMAATTLLGAMFHQIGPRVQGLLGPQPTAQQALLDAEFAKVGYEPAAAVKSTRTARGADPADVSAPVPRQDLLVLLNKSVPTDLACVEGKTSWIGRKAALEAILAACVSSGHYLECNKGTMDLLRSIKARLGDTQANLKPLAAQVVGAVLVSFDVKAAARALAAVGTALLSGVSDNKKPMRDACLAALDAIVTQRAADGNAAGAAAAADAVLMSALVAPLAEVLNNSVSGRLEVLGWMQQHSESFRMDASSTCELAAPLVAALQDKQAPVRSAAESVLIKLAQQNCLTLTAFDKATRDLSAATKRSFQGALDRIQAVLEPSASDETPAPRLGAAERLLKAPEPPAPRLGAPERSVKAAAKAHAPTSAAAAAVSVSASATVAAATVSTAVAPLTEPAPTTVHDAASENVSILRKTNKSARLDDRKLHWPTEGDIGETEFLVLQAQWEPLIVSAALKEKLFPNNREGGATVVLYNQDNLIAALDEFSAICRDPNFMQHLDLVFRWLSYALCVRETSNGLLRVLQAISEVAAVVSSQDPHAVPLPDAETGLLLPHLIEHSGHKSERHRAAYRTAMEAMCAVASAKAYQQSLLSGLACKNKRTRVVCLEELSLRVASTGYATLGRAGLKDIGSFIDARDGDMAGRNACLDLCVHLYHAMGSDSQKLFKTLGDVSERARALVEARIKHTGGPAAATAAGQKEPGSNHSTPVKATGAGNAAAASSQLQAHSLAAQAKKQRSPILGNGKTAAPAPAARKVPAPVVTTGAAMEGDSPFRLVMTPPESSSKTEKGGEREKSARKRFGADSSAIFDTSAMDAKLTELSAVMTSLNMSMTPGQLLSPRAKAKARMSAATDTAAATTTATRFAGPNKSPGTPEVAESGAKKDKSRLSDGKSAGGRRSGSKKKNGSGGTGRASLGSQSTPSPVSSPTGSAAIDGARKSPTTAAAAASTTADDIYSDIISKMDKLLCGPLPASEHVHDDATDYIKILHSIASGTWSAEERTEAENSELRMHADALLSRLVGCVQIAFSENCFVSPARSPGSGLKIDVSLASASLATMFSLLRHPKVIASMSMRACAAVLQCCLQHLVDPRLTPTSTPGSSAGVGAPRASSAPAATDSETAEQIIRALNIIALKLAAEMPPVRAMAALLGVATASTQGKAGVAALAIKPTSKLLLRVIGEEMRSSKPFQSNPRDTAELLQSLTGLLSGLDASNAHEAAFACGKTVLTELVTSLGGRHVLAALQAQGAASTSAVVKLAAKLSGTSISTGSDLQEKVTAILNEIVRSKDKSLPIASLWALQCEHPQLDVQQYASHLSSAHRRFIADKMASMQTQAQAQSTSVSSSNSLTVAVAKSVQNENILLLSIGSSSSSSSGRASDASEGSPRTSLGSNHDGSARKSQKKKRRSGVGIGADDGMLRSEKVTNENAAEIAEVLQLRKSDSENLPSLPQPADAKAAVTLPPPPPVPAATGDADSDLMARFARLKFMTNKM